MALQKIVGMQRKQIRQLSSSYKNLHDFTVQISHYGNDIILKNVVPSPSKILIFPHLNTMSPTQETACVINSGIC